MLISCLAPSLPASTTASLGNMGIRFGKASSEYNSGNICFHQNVASSATNFISLGLHTHNHILIVNGQERVGIKNTAPISELDVTGGISWSSKATSQYNATDDCVEFVFV